MRYWQVLAAVMIALYCSAMGDKMMNIFCYIGSWAEFRPGRGHFKIKNVDPTLCTHLVYAFVNIDSDSNIVLFDPKVDLPDHGGKDGFNKFLKLSERNPDAKYMVGIGGWNADSANFSQSFSTKVKRTRFIKNAVAFCKKYNFDGMDIHWEYPGRRTGADTVNDKPNFALLLKELAPAFKTWGLILSAAVNAVEFNIDISYDVFALSKYLDFINVMTYDLHGNWDPVTGQNAPLYSSTEADVTDTDKLLNVKHCIEAWLSRKADPKKINMGMATYGHAFTLADPNNTSLGAKSAGQGLAGPYTRQAGILGYNEICEKHKEGKWMTVWDDEQKVPYTYKGDQWIGYDNVKSLELKVEFAKSMGLGGFMIWSMETDDFTGWCQLGVNVLLSAVNRAIEGEDNTEFE